jgi:hypothetical protein
MLTLLLDRQAILDWMANDPRLDRIIKANRTLDQATDELRAAVLEARQTGLSWAQIGYALGTTRQGAQQRFGAYELTDT